MLFHEIVFQPVLCQTLSLFNMRENFPVGYRVTLEFVSEFNFVYGQFFVFCGKSFLRLGKTAFSFWGLIFVIFQKVAISIRIKTFSLFI